MPKKQKKETSKYIVRLEMKNGEKFKATASTVILAMDQIELDPKTMGLLSVDFGDKHVERMVNASHLKRLFSPKVKPYIKRIAVASYSKYLISGLC